MKKIILLASMAIIAASCNNKGNNDNSTNPPAEQPAPAPTPAAAPAKKEPDGTTIKVDDNGVSYSKKSGTNESHVKVAGDSTSVEIKK